MHKSINMKRLFLFSVVFLLSTHTAWADSYYYYLGPHVVTPLEGGGGVLRGFPEGTAGAVDLSSDVKNVAFFAVTQPLGTGYAFLGQGDCQTMIATPAMQDTWEAATGFRPSGARLVDLLFSQFTDGSDVSGQNAVRPLVPTVEGDLEIWLYNTKVRNEKFHWGTHPYTAQLKALYRYEYRKIEKEMKDKEKRLRKLSKIHGDSAWQIADKHIDQEKRVLDYWAEQYGVDWREFVPDDMQVGHSGPLPHATTLTEDFDQTDSTTVGPDQTWTEVSGGWQTVSNKLRKISGNAQHENIRCSTAVSSQNHSTTLTISASHSSNAGGPIIRHSSSSSSFYVFYHVGNTVYLRDYTTGPTITEVATAVANTFSTPRTYKIEGNGSTISGYLDGSSTATISGTDASYTNLYGGVFEYGGSTYTPRCDMDDWILADAPLASVKTVNGLAIASVKTKNGLAKASIKTINGL